MSGTTPVKQNKIRNRGIRGKRIHYLPAGGTLTRCGVFYGAVQCTQAEDQVTCKVCSKSLGK